MNVANNIPKNLILESVAYGSMYLYQGIINEHTLKGNEKGKYLIFEQF